MKTAIKICGITTVEDAKFCTEIGIDYIGFNFVPSSPRCISAKKAIELKAHCNDAKLVGIFMDQTEEEVEKIISETAIDQAQFHGSEDVDFIRSISVPSIKAFRYIPDIEEIETYLFAGCMVMLDGKKNGDTVDWNELQSLPEDIRSHMFLAGGLHANNVQEAISTVTPFGVDVASGIEVSPGIKDHSEITKFVKNVHSTSSFLHK